MGLGILFKSLSEKFLLKKSTNKLVSALQFIAYVALFGLGLFIGYMKLTRNF